MDALSPRPGLANELAFVKTSLCISDKCWICLLEQIKIFQEILSDIFLIHNVYARPAKKSMFDGVNESKYLGDIVCTSVSCLSITIPPHRTVQKLCCRV